MDCNRFPARMFPRAIGKRSLSTALFFFCFLAAGAAQGIAQDLVNAVRISDCCFTMSLRNANQSGDPITRFQVKSLPGTVILQNGSGPSGWSISYAGSTSVIFDSPVNPIQPGAFLDGFTLCFQTPGNGFIAEWQTENTGVVLTGGILPLACRNVDSVAVRVDTSDCCFGSTLKNRNALQRSITRFSLTLVTPGFTWGNGTQAPSPGWTVQQPLPEQIMFEGKASPLTHDLDLSGFTSCLWPPSTVQDRVFVEWITWNDTSVVTRDTIAIQCHPLQACDAVLFEQNGAGSCCYMFTLFNNHQPGGSVNGLRFQILTPGASITGTPAGPWFLKRSTPTEAAFNTAAIGIDDGKAINGFVLCFENAPGNPEPVRVLWQSNRDGNTICQDTILVPCRASGPLCDYVSAQAGGAAPPRACCYALTLNNTHTPLGPLDGLRLRILTPAVLFAGAPTGPWSVSSSTSTTVLFKGGGPPLPGGGSSSPFDICLHSNGPGTILVEWESSNGATVLCRDTLRLACTPAASVQCDSLLLSKKQDCSYDLGIVNRHAPSGAVTGFQVQVTTAGASLGTVTAPSGWLVQSSTATSVSFASTGAGVQPGTQQTGFLLTVQPSASGDAALQWCSAFNGSILCCDTASLHCTAPPQLCDSLQVTDGAAQCSYLLALINRHQPASPLSGFRIVVTTPGAGIAAAAAPAGWVAENRTGTSVAFRDTSGTLATKQRADGFQLSFTPATGNTAVFFQWCSVMNGKDVCCASITVQCREQQTRADSVGMQPTAEACTFSATVANRHVPASTLDALTIRIATPGAAFTSVSAPAGWHVTQQTSTVATFRDSSGGLASGSLASGFLLGFSPSPNGSAIRMQWCTSLRGNDISCDSALVECQTQNTSRDSVKVLQDGSRDCCYEFRAFNRHLPSSLINGFRLTVLTPGVTLFTGLVGAPPGWTPTATPGTVTWKSLSQGLSFGSVLPSCIVCFDNNATGNHDFDVRWETLLQSATVSADTVRIVCARTLDVERVDGTLPTTLALAQNYPNPFAQQSTVEFDVPGEQSVRLELVDATGSVIRTLVDAVFERGRYRVAIEAGGLPNGLYFCRLTGDRAVLTRTLLIIH